VKDDRRRAKYCLTGPAYIKKQHRHAIVDYHPVIPIVQIKPPPCNLQDAKRNDGSCFRRNKNWEHKYFWEK